MAKAGLRLSVIRYCVLNVFVHGLGDLFAVGHGFHNGSGAVDHVTGGKDTGTAGSAAVIGFQKAFLGCFQSCGGVDDGILGTLADGNHDTVRGDQSITALYFG